MMFLPSYQSPLLAQLVATRPIAGWSINRLSRGFNGAILGAQRQDSAQQTCWTIKELKQFFGSQNGGVRIFPDQFGSSPQVGNSAQVYVGATGKMNQVGTLMYARHDWNHYIADGRMGLPNGSPAITSALVLAGCNSGEMCPFSIGDASVGGNDWSFYKWTDTELQVLAAGPNRRFTFTPSILTGRHSFVISKGLNAPASTWTARQNGQDMPVVGVGEGAQNLQSGHTWLAQRGPGWAYFTGNIAALLHWSAQLTGPELAALEQGLRAMRVM